MNKGKNNSQDSLLQEWKENTPSSDKSESTPLKEGNMNTPSLRDTPLQEGN